MWLFLMLKYDRTITVVLILCSLVWILLVAVFIEVFQFIESLQKSVVGFPDLPYRTSALLSFLYFECILRFLIGWV